MSGEKTEEPTEEKLRKSREKGEVPGRKNILEAIIIATGVAGVAGTYPILVTQIGNLFDVVLRSPGEPFEQTLSQLAAPGQALLIYLISFAGALGAFTLFGNLMLNKFNFAPKSLSIKFSKLNPVSGLKNIFSLTTVYNFIRMTSIFITISVVTYVAIRGNMGDGVDASACGMVCLAAIFPGILLRMVLSIILVLMLFAMLDYRIQNALFRKQQKMTKDEVKREYKSSEGDPHIKGARQNIGEETIFMPSMKEVTHVVYSNSVLVAFLHTPNSAPYVVMKSRGNSVSALQQRFRQMGKKCVNLPDVATKLHKSGTIGRYLRGKEEAQHWYKVLAAFGDV